MDNLGVLRLIEQDYDILKNYECGDCFGANRKQLQPSIISFVSVVRRFYTNVDLLSEDGVFSVGELSRIGDCIRAVDRESQNKDIDVVVRVLMYDIEDIMRMVKSKLIKK